MNPAFGLSLLMFFNFRIIQILSMFKSNVEAEYPPEHPTRDCRFSASHPRHPTFHIPPQQNPSHGISDPTTTYTTHQIST